MVLLNLRGGAGQRWMREHKIRAQGKKRGKMPDRAAASLRFTLICKTHRMSATAHEWRGSGASVRQYLWRQQTVVDSHEKRQQAELQGTLVVFDVGCSAASACINKFSV